MSPKKRTEQIASEIREHLALLLCTGQVSDPRLKSITITGVRVAKDLQIADVSYSTLGSETERKLCAEALKKASGYFRSSLAQAMSLRYTPALRFHFDEGIEHGARISALLNSVLSDTHAGTSS